MIQILPISARSNREGNAHQQYRIRPYLANSDFAELVDRFETINSNGLTIDHECHIALGQPQYGGEVWLDRFFHLDLECKRRGIDVRELARSNRLGPVLATASIPDPKEFILKNRDLFQQGVRRKIYCKFGDKHWIDRLVSHGELRLTPASSYAAPSLGTARSDDELTMPIVITPYDYDLRTLPESVRPKYPARKWHRVRHSKLRDHLIYCVTCTMDPRYFLDFSTDAGIADACAVFSNQAEFSERLLAAASEKLEGWSLSFQSVRYIDPFMVVAYLGTLDSLFQYKDFRFMYQREFRLIAVPPATTPLMEKLDYVNLRLGSLKDIAEVVTI